MRRPALVRHARLPRTAAVLPFPALLLLLLLLAGGGPAAAAGGGGATPGGREAAKAADPALAGIEALRSALAGTRDFTAVVEQEKEVSLLRRKIASRGVVRFKRPGLFYMRIDPPHESVLLLRGGILALRFPGERVTEEIPLPPEQSLDRWIAKLDGPVRSLPEGVSVSAERSGGGWRLRIVPKDGKGLKEVQVDLSGDGTVTRLSLEEENRDRTVMRFSRVKRNAGIPDSDFRID